MVESTNKVINKNATKRGLEWGRREEGRGMSKERKIKVNFIHNKKINNHTLIEVFTKKISEQGFDKYKEK